jgi:hypothetical protein
MFLYQINNFLYIFQDSFYGRVRFKVTILEIPVYSIVSWNKHSGHKNPEKFAEQDSQLENQIYKLNGQIRQLIYLCTA